MKVTPCNVLFGNALYNFLYLFAAPAHESWTPNCWRPFLLALHQKVCGPKKMNPVLGQVAGGK
jgi:hypothetical protein